MNDDARLGGRHGNPAGDSPQPMLKTYIVIFRYKGPNDKALGPVRQFRIHATNLDEARRLLARYANYPNLEVVNIREA